MRVFEVGSSVLIRLEPSEQRGMPHPRYQGRVGTILGRRGRAYEIELNDAGKRKVLISDPVHLAPMEKNR